MAEPQMTLQELAKQRGVAPEEPEEEQEPGSLSALAQSRGVEIDTADTSPLPVPENKTTRIGGTFGASFDAPGFEPFSPVRPENDPLVKAAKAGVIYNQPAPAGHALVGFAFNDEERLKAWKFAMEDLLGRDVKVRMGPETGEEEYFDPSAGNGGRWVLVDPPGYNKGDFANMAGPAISLALETAIMGPATMAGGLTGPGGIALAAGAAIPAAMLGEGIRISIGHSMGINQDLDPAEVTAHLAKIGAMAGGTGMAAESLFRLARVVFDFAFGLTSAKQITRDLNLSLEDAARLEDAINERLTDASFRLRLDQASNNETLLSFAEVMRKDPAFAEVFRELSNEQNAALRSFWDEVNRPFRVLTRSDAPTVQDAAAGAVKNKQAKQDAFVLVKRAELDTMVNGLQDTAESSVGIPLRSIVTKQDKQLDEWAARTVHDFNQAVGGEPIVTLTRTTALANELADAQKDAIFPFQKNELKRIIGERRTVTTQTEGAMQLGDDGLLGFDTIEAEEVVDRLFDPDAKFTVQETWEALSALKRLKRRSAPILAEPANEKALNGMITALEKDLRSSMPTSATSMYDEFVRAYATETNRLRRGTVGQIMALDETGRRYVIENAKVFDTIFEPGSVRNAEELFAAISGSPEHMDITRRAIIRNWKDAVMKEDGTVNQTAHKKWMKDHKDQAAVFLDGTEMSALGRAKGVQQALDARIANREKVFKEISDSVEGQVVKYRHIEDLARDMLDPRQPGFADDVMNIMRRQNRPPEDMMRALQSEVRERFLKRVSNSGRRSSFELSPTKLKNTLHGPDNIQDNLRVVFGDQYVDDLLVLDEAFEFVTRRSQGENFSNTAAGFKVLNDIARAYIGLFTRAGRVLTAGNRIRGRAANQALMTSVVTPDNLRTLISLKDAPIQDPRVIQFLSTIGATGLLLDEDPVAGETAEAP